MPGSDARLTPGMVIQNDEALEEAPRLLMPQATPVSLPATCEDIRELGDRKCDITDIQALPRRVASSSEYDR